MSSLLLIQKGLDVSKQMKRWCLANGFFAHHAALREGEYKNEDTKQRNQSKGTKRLDRNSVKGQGETRVSLKLPAKTFTEIWRNEVSLSEPQQIQYRGTVVGI